MGGSTSLLCLKLSAIKIMEVFFVLCLIFPPLGLWWLIRRFLRGPTTGTDNPKRLDGRVVVITDANTGIGEQTAMNLAGRGAEVFNLCRSLEKGNRSKDKILESNPDAKIEVRECDLSDLASIRDCCSKLNKELTRIDYLINNAGLMTCPLSWRTKDGFDMQFGVNHLGHVLLTEMLLPLLKESAKTYRPRIVILSSLAHLGGDVDFDDLNFEKRRSMKLPHMVLTTMAYNNSKLANVLHAKALAQKLKPHGITTYSLHPGVIPNSNLFQHVESYWWFRPFRPLLMPIAKATCKRTIDGAQTSLYCILEDSLDQESGEYYSGCAKARHHRIASDDEVIEKLYQESLRMVGL